MSNHKNMNDKDFYAFRKSLEKQRDIQYDESHWEELNQRMDRPNTGKRPVLGWWMAAAAAILALLFGNLFLFGNLNETRQMNVQLQDRLERNSLHQTDTIWREKTVYLHDTLTNEKIVYREVKSVPGEYQKLQEILTSEEIVALHEGKLPERLRNFPGESPTDKATLATAQGQEANKLPETPKLDLNYTPNLLGYKTNGPVTSIHNWGPEWNDYLTEIEMGEKKTPLLLKVKRNLQPKGLAIGVSSGPIIPISEKIGQPRGWTIGLNGEFLFSDHLRLRAEVSYVKVSYTSSSMDPSLGIPVTQSPGDDFVFDQAQVVQDALHFDFLMKYLMATRKKLQPFVYAGYGTASIFPYKVYYDFKNTVLESEVQTEDEIGSTYLISGFGMVGAGMSYSLGNHLSLQLDGFYRRQLSKSSLSNPDIASLRASALYSF